MRCKHADQQWYAWWQPGEISPLLGTWHAFIQEVDGEPDKKLCLDCGTWLPLGPSDEEPVAAEIRAAELAARVTEQRARGKSPFLSDIGFDSAEIAGWIECQYDSEKLPEQPGEHAGYLARAIIEHNHARSSGGEGES